MGVAIQAIGEKRVVIVDGVRTPFAKSGGPLATVSAAELGRVAVSELLARTEFEAARVDEVVLGNCGTPADAANIGRVVSLAAGIPRPVPAFTVHRNCASGIEAIAQAWYKIASGAATAVVAGGTESMSEYPLLWSRGLTRVFANWQRAKSFPAKVSALLGLRPHDFAPRVAIAEGLTDPVCGLNMGETAENLAKEYRISREAQDEFALLSHQRAVAATDAGRLAEETTPFYIAPKYTPLTEDFGPRRNQTLEALAKLKPYFDRRHGTVTVGNSCPVTDGACALLVMEETRARAEGYRPLGRIRSFSFAGCDPARMGLGPAYATPLALDRAGLRLSDIELIEINEAFAAQVIANEIVFASAKFAAEELGRSEPIGGIDRSRMNVNGGAIALGHPVGVSGARIVLTLLEEMRRRQAGIGLATLCVGGGQGAAMIVEAA
ncbi:MAG TPA: thiolase family protein [Candidatus Eisenbacteria bacterium]|nr:thiolase family protein [Candidatus Eisenbacteria bacterium]